MLCSDLRSAWDIGRRALRSPCLVQSDFFRPDILYMFDSTICEQIPHNFEVAKNLLDFFKHLDEFIVYRHNFSKNSFVAGEGEVRS